MSKKKFPISRLHRFYDYMDFNLEDEMAREFVEGDLNFTVVLFMVDRIKSQTDDVYGESSTQEIRFQPPVEIKVRPQLEKSESKAYSDGRNDEHQSYTTPTTMQDYNYFPLVM